MTRPNKTRQDLIDETLLKLHTAVPGIKASVVVNRDGLLVAAYPAGDDTDDDNSNPTNSPQVAAMAATLIGLAERTLGRLGQGELERTLMEGEHGTMVIYPAGRATLAVLISRSQKLGPVLYASNYTAQEIATILRG